MQVRHFAVADSTNALALALAGQGAAHGAVVHADQQTGGRGRGNRSFCSPLGGLYFSVVLRPALEPADWPIITLAAAVGLRRGIRQAAGVLPQLKWPNDLYLAGRKLGGILTESGPLHGGLPAFAVVGAGVNVAAPPSVFPPDLRAKVISLSETGAECSPAALLPPLRDAMLAAVSELEAGGRDELLAEWRSADCLLGSALECDSNGETLLAVGAGLAEDGRYVVVDERQREHRLVAGDISPIRRAAP